jgi:hypothetical protein
MTIAADDTYNYNYPTAASSNYPTAPVVLVVGNDTQPSASVDPCNNVFADAQLIDLSDGSNYAPVATSATATPLDPWTKKPMQSMQSTVLTTTPPPPGYSNYCTPPLHQTNLSHQNPVITHAAVTAPGALSENPMDKKQRRRRRRRTRMIVSGSAGFVVGTIFGGPIGAIVGAGAGAGVARGASKAGEQRKDKRVQREIANQMEQRGFN